MQSNTVLVVESDPTILHYSIGFIEDAGFATFGAATGEAATSILQEHPHVEATFIDVDAPGGGALLRMMQRHFPQIRLVITGTGAPQGDARVPAGARYFQKPFPPHEVANSLKQVANSLQYAARD